jgi:hypothetical protein
MKHVGNCSWFINWNKLVDELPEVATFRGFETSDTYENPTTIARVEKGETLEYEHVRDQGDLVSAYENNDSLEFVTYSAGKHYPRKIDQLFADWLGVDPAISWISRVGVGKVAAPHIDDEECYWTREHFPNRKLTRYHCHISPPEIGAAFMIEKECYHMLEIGDVVKWPSIDSLHCGVNGSVKDKLLYHFIGAEK